MFGISTTILFTILSVDKYHKFTNNNSTQVILLMNFREKSGCRIFASVLKSSI
jgi:hypothetical protein